MSDQKTTQLSVLTAPAGEDLVFIVDNPTGTPVSKKISLQSLLAQLPANTSISGTLTVSANTTLNGSNTVVSANVNLTSLRGPRISAPYVTIAKSSISSNNATSQLASGGMQGSIMWDSNYLYVATSNTEIKRVALNTFNS